MLKGLFEETISAFEERMELRRKMLKATGVKVKKRRVDKDLENRIRESIITCHECNSSDTCHSWLEHAQEGAVPPHFCPNHDLILQLKEEGHTQKVVK